MERVVRFARRAVAAACGCVWCARWWIVAAVALCAVDESIRHKVFHTSTWRDIRLCAFYSAAAIAPAFLLGRFTRFVAPVLFGCWTFVEALQLWVALNFHMTLGGNWILMAFSTSGGEVAEFAQGLLTFGNLAYVALALAGVAAVAWFFAGRRDPAATAKGGSRSLATAKGESRPLATAKGGLRPLATATSICLAAACALFSARLAPRLFRAPVSWAQISRDLLALNLPADTIPNWRAYRTLARACRETPPYSLSIGGEPRLCVFVIGESTTRNHMGLYGYPRRTTPELESIRAEGGLTAFADLTTTHPSTPEALCSLLTGCELGSARKIDVVFPAMLKKAGYRTMLISCQGHWQNRDVVGTHLFRSCDSREFLQGGRVAGTLPDGVALPEVERAIRENKAPLALFVHLYGCHNPASKRVPPDFRREWPVATAKGESRPVATGSQLPDRQRRKIDSYDTAVAYDDYVVASIVRLAKAAGVPACVVFVSDHGESPSSAIWRDAKSRDTYEVPLVVWLSPEYRAAFRDTSARVAAARDRRLRMDRLLEGLLELSGVDGYRPRDSADNFLSPQFSEDAR